MPGPVFLCVRGGWIPEIDNKSNKLPYSLKVALERRCGAVKLAASTPSWMHPMQRFALAAALGLALVPTAHAAVDCSAPVSASPLPLPATAIAPVAEELYIRNVQLGMPAGVLTSSYDREQSLDSVLQRLRIDGCQNIAKAIPSAPVINPNDPAAYKPQTEFDNTPWRFDMSQGGKRMTAEEFDAWMKARGVRVVKARPAAAEVPAAAPAPEVK